MIKTKKGNLLNGLGVDSRPSRYDYKKVAVDYNSITVGSEESFKESR